MVKKAQLTNWKICEKTITYWKRVAFNKLYFKYKKTNIFKAVRANLKYRREHQKELQELEEERKTYNSKFNFADTLKDAWENVMKEFPIEDKETENLEKNLKDSGWKRLQAACLISVPKKDHQGNVGPLNRFSLKDERVNEICDSETCLAETDGKETGAGLVYSLCYIIRK